MGDFNAKVGKEEAFREIVGNESLLGVSNKNGKRLIDFAMGNGMVVKSMSLQRMNIRKATWNSPDGTTFNQTDHMVIDRGHASDILEVDSCKEVDCDLDHFMVRGKFRQCTAIYRSRGKRKAPQRYNVSKLKEKGVSEKYETELQKKCEALERI
ncbi:craniofacial development protein 2-like [Schistocerca nitens]|uniref:craniofacial development protein 2-like n=1 Tax=Schistocerca nitens TaxID=7011 RepID=UPI00211847D0|nr:craniofacial development protein 2-like [Schistocerca nitens]